MVEQCIVTPDDERKRPLTILVVEDEILIRMAAAEYLRDCGYRVIEAANAAEAQSLLLSGEQIAIMFSDVTMPGEMNGAALTVWAGQKFPNIKTILTTGGANKSIDVDSLPPGTVFMPKPYSLDRLAGHIKNLLS